ncbi:BamA/TamA family outer membrane protein [bacterium]|nr:BamA/TamA family outer membrane protein [bacterium]
MRLYKSILLLISLLFLMENSIFASELYRVDTIEIRCEDYIDKEFWLDFISIKPGDFVTESRIKKIKERILATESFLNVFVQKITTENSNKISFFFTKKQIVKEIQISGNFPLLESEVKRKLFFKIGEPFDSKKIDDSKKNVENLYEESGFFDAKVDIKYEYSKDYHYVYLYVNVSNIGIELQIDNIISEFKGELDTVEKKILMKQVESILKPTYYESLKYGFTYNDFKTRMENARLFLQQKGYITAKIRSKNLKTSDEGDVLSYDNQVLEYYGKDSIENNQLLDVRKRGFVINYKKRAVDLWVIVDFGPKVTLQFEGFDEITMKEIKDNISLYTVGSVSPSEVDNSVKKLEKYYQSLGYYFIKIESKIERKEDGNSEFVNVKFMAKEPKPLYIRKIVFKGITHTQLIDNGVFELMETGVFNYLGSKGFLQDGMFVNDLNKIIDFYRKDGYLNAFIKNIYFDFYKNREFLEITIELEEGKQSYFKKIEIEGNYHFSANKINSVLVELSSGKNGFNPTIFQKNRDIIEQFYQSNGYPFVEVKRFIKDKKGVWHNLENLSEEFKSEDDFYTTLDSEIKLKYKIIENHPIKFGEVFIYGNFETSRKTIESEIVFDKGEFFNYKKLQETRDNIRGLGVFKRVTIRYPKLKIGEGVQDILVFLEEDHNQYLDFSIGTSSDEKYTTSIEIVEQNLLGYAKKVSLLGKVGEIYNRAELNFVDPRFSMFGIFNLFGSFRLVSSFKVFYRYETLPSFTLNSYGGNLSFSKLLFSKLNISFAIEAEQAKTERYYSRNIVEPDIFDLIEHSTTTSFIVSLYFENRDNPFDPRRGNMLRFTTKLATRINFIDVLGGGDEFFKYEFEYSHYVPFTPSFILALSLRFGAVIPTNPERERIPEKERFFLGGDNTIRGYDLNMVGEIENNSPLGDTSKLLVNAEFRTPLRLIKNIWLAFFVDAGGLAPKITDFFEKTTYQSEGKNLIRYSAGIGIRYMTIIGPVRLDLGYKLNDTANDDDDYKFHFNFSYPF